MTPNQISLAYYTGDAGSLDLGDFAKLHGTAFLVSYASLGEGSRQLKTVAIEGEGERQSVADEMNVFSVRNSGSGAFPGFVSVGRVPNNDIVLEDASLSKFHAFFRERDNRFALQDAGSMNGTFINGERIFKEEEPTMVSSGTRIGFGSVRVTFLLVEDFIALVGRLA